MIPAIVHHLFSQYFRMKLNRIDNCVLHHVSFYPSIQHFFSTDVFNKFHRIGNLTFESRERFWFSATALYMLNIYAVAYMHRSYAHICGFYVQQNLDENFYDCGFKIFLFHNNIDLFVFFCIFEFRR